MNSFYVGYLPKAPREIARFVQTVVVLLLLIVIVVGVTLVATQRQFDRSKFEFTNVRTFHGAIEARPYPSLLIGRPGKNSDGRRTSRYLLVGVGKHGAEVSDYDGAAVELKGKLIYRAEQTMIEVMPGSVRREDAVAVKAVDQPATGPMVTIKGEIVDSKCHTGVMNPGSGKVHRDCAVRCLSGGVPPLLVEESAPNRIFLMTDSNADRLAPEMFIDRVAEPVAVTGYVAMHGDRLELRVREISRIK